jgi:hypothetical protein
MSIMKKMEISSNPKHLSAVLGELKREAQLLVWLHIKDYIKSSSKYVTLACPGDI